MNRSFTALFLDSFRKVYGPLCTIGGLILAVALWLWKPEQQIPLGLVVVTMVPVLLILLTSLQAINIALRLTMRVPEVKSAIPPRNDMDGLLGCLLEPSELFSVNAQVAFYYRWEEGYEILIGRGYVRNVQDDRFIFVTMTEAEVVYRDVIDRLRENSKAYVDRLKVKPSVPMMFRYRNSSWRK